MVSKPVLGPSCAEARELTSRSAAMCSCQVHPASASIPASSRSTADLKARASAAAGASPPRAALECLSNAFLGEAVRVRLLDPVVGDPAAGRVECVVAVSDRGDEIVIAADGCSCRDLEPPDPRVEPRGHLDGQRGIRTEGGHHPDRERRVSSESLVVLEGVGRVIRRAEHPHVHLLQQPARAVVIPGELRGALGMDRARVVRPEHGPYSEIAGQLQLRPVEERIAQRGTARPPPRPRTSRGLSRCP